MCDALHFIFSSFWVWLGTLLLVGAMAGSIASVLGQIARIMRK